MPYPQTEFDSVLYDLVNLYPTEDITIRMQDYAKIRLYGDLLVNGSLVSGDPYVNVKSFGATGDGVTNDRVAIQAAINAAFTATVPCFFPSGTYLISGDKLSCKGKIVGAGRKNTVIKQGSTNQGILDFDSVSDCEVSDLTLESNSSATHYRSLWIRGAGLRNEVHRINIINGGCYVSGGNAAYDTPSPPPTTPGLQQRLILDSIWVDNAKEYGISIDCVQGVEIVSPEITSAAIDGVKCLHDCDDVTITGGFATGCGQEGLDCFMGGRNLTIIGFKAISNAGNGITIKTDDNTYAGAYQHNMQVNITGVICRNNNVGMTIDRNGSVDDPALPLLSHVVVNGGLFDNNVAQGIKVRARNVSLLGVVCRRNGTQGIRFEPESMDCEAISPQVSGNSMTTVGASDGININGTRNKVIGGFSIGKDADTIKNDGDYAGLTAQQRYGAIIVSGSVDCEIHNTVAFGNATADVFTSGTRGLLRTRQRMDILDAPGTTIRSLTVDSSGRLLLGATIVGTQT